VDLTPQTLLAVSETVSNLVFPLIILLVGAGVSGYFVPRILNAREERRKSLEVRTALVAEIADAVTSFLMAIQFADVVQRRVSMSRGIDPDAEESATEEAGDDSDIFDDPEVRSSIEDANEAYKTWEIESAIIGTKLTAYFPDSELNRRWAEFSQDLISFYAAIGVPQHLRGETYAELRQRHPGGKASPKGPLYGGLLATHSELIKTVLTTPSYLG
jgi:hypothetical protein